MSTKDTNTSLESVYADYLRTRAIHPGSDYEPLLRAANDTLNSTVDATADQEIEMCWDDDDASRQISMLYRQWRDVSVDANQLDAIRERVINRTLDTLRAPVRSNTVEAADAIDIDSIRSRVMQNTMEVARVSNMNESADSAVVTQAGRPGLSKRFMDWCGVTDRGFGLAPAGMSAAMVGAILMTALWNGAPDEPAGDMAAIAMIPGDIIQRADQLGPTVGAAIQASFDYRHARTPEARAFGLGVGSVDLMMALQSGDANRSASAARGMLGLSEGNDKWSLVNQSAGDVLNQVDKATTVSSKAMTRSAALLDKIRDSLGTDAERSSFELGRWVEMSYLTADLAARTGDTAVLTQTLKQVGEWVNKNEQKLVSLKSVEKELLAIQQIDTSKNVSAQLAGGVKRMTHRIKTLVK